MKGKKSTNVSTSDVSNHKNMSLEQQEIAEWLQKIQFRKQMFGGVSEQDVWKKINELNDLYNQALVAERARYNALLERKKLVTTEKKRASVNNPRRRITEDV